MTPDKGAQIIEKAKEMGAAIAGIASIESIKRSPSHKVLTKLGIIIDGVGSDLGMNDFHEIKWPVKAKAALVIAVPFPQDKPELDWSDASGNTPGNQLLQRINRELSAWIEEALGIKTHKMSYWVEKGGVYLKDAAVLGGFGCIGRNNLLITPEFGPRVRLRGMLLEYELSPTGPITFDPCDNCEAFCRKVCPQNAFDRVVLTSIETEMCTLPGRDGYFSRAKCTVQMDKDLDDARIDVAENYLSGVETEVPLQPTGRIKWCRRCELACPVGS